MKKPRKQNKMAVGIAWYRRSQYPMLLEVSEDRDSMHSNYLDWEREATKNNQVLVDQGLYVEKVDVELNELLQWCKRRGMPIDGNSRSQYAMEWIQNKYQKDKQ